MITRLARVTIYVRDPDEALHFYVDQLGLVKRADQRMPTGDRWLTVSPQGQTDVEIVLQQPSVTMHGEENAQRLTQRIGQGTTWVFYTDDCRKDYETFLARGVSFRNPPAERPYGVEAVFQDPYGNTFSLLEPRR